MPKKKKSKKSGSVESKEPCTRLEEAQIADYYSKIEFRQKVPKLIRWAIIASAPSVSIIKIAWTIEFKSVVEKPKVVVDFAWLDSFLLGVSDYLLLSTLYWIVIIILSLTLLITYVRFRNVVRDRMRLVRHCKLVELELDKSRTSSNINDSTVGNI